MKHAASVPKSIRIIERDAFLSSVETKGNILLRARTENPGNHLLVIFSDEEERYAIIGEIGPESQFADIREAMRRAPAGLTVHFVVPCVQCPPFVIPKGHDIVPLPASLGTLTPPPADFDSPAAATPEAPVDTGEEGTPSFKMVGIAANTAPGISFSRKTKTPPPVRSTAATTAPFAAPSEAPAAGALSPSAAVSPAAGAERAVRETPAAAPAASPLVNQAMQDASRALSERESDLRRRETELAVKTTALSKERRLFEDDTQRVNAEIESRETELFRREAELQSRADALLRNLRDLEELRRKIESLAGRSNAGR